MEIRLRTFLTVLLAVSSLAGCSREDLNNRDWPYYLGDPTSSQYSPLRQITRENVSRLEVAWTYRTGDARQDNRSEMQCNPLVIDGVLYGSSAGLRFFALEAATGKELWVFDPHTVREQQGRDKNRGVAYWTDGSESRILAAASRYLFSLDARTGKPDPGFGDQGVIDLRQGMAPLLEDPYVAARTPGIVFEDLFIIGGVVDEVQGAAPGHIRAFDVRTGALVWIFHTVPQPGEFGYETWPPDSWYGNGGANSWAGLALDMERAMVFAPTGSASFDFYGGDRVGQNLFANSILALDARTGKRIWHYQTIHHDIWDRDLPAPPNLVTVTHNGRRIDAVAQITKTGQTFVLDRETGEPLFPVEEKPFPPSDLRGEEAWPTQPIPTLPEHFTRQSFGPEDVTTISPEANARALQIFKRIRWGALFVPPSTKGTLVFPGLDGGGEWGGAAYDPSTGVLYVNANEGPNIITMFEIVPADEGDTIGQGRNHYLKYCARCHGADLKGGSFMGEVPSLIGIADRIPLSEVGQNIRDGKGSMPSFGQLSEEQVIEIARFLHSGTDVKPTAPREKSGVDSEELPTFSLTGYNPFRDSQEYPAIEPPWGTLNAIDLNTGKILWKVPLGEFEELTLLGNPVTGSQNYGGPVVTASGLLFIGATSDEKFHVFDKDTGEILWETRLPAGGYATPATYSVDGKQYVVIACGGGKQKTKSGDTYVAFALPEDELKIED